MLPIINTQTCTRCGLCISDCIANAIDPQTMKINADSCMGCGHCTAVCPTNAVSLVTPDHAPVAQDATDNSFATLVRMRRSIRQYKPAEITPEHLQSIIDVVRYAPTGTNTQAVAVTILASREKVQQAVGLALSYFRKVVTFAINPLTKPFLYLFMGATMTRKLSNYKRRLLEAPKVSNGRDILAHNAPALFIFHAPTKSSTPIEDAVIWATTANYHAETLGIATCYNGFLTRGINGSKALKKWLGIPKGNKVYSTFTAGYPAVKYQRPAPRKATNVSIIK